ncbi:MAG: Holliday junction resolvase RuvX [Planctomycetota bacterium]
MAAERRRAALGVDHGTKRTGLAVADPTRIVVTPLGAVSGSDADVLDEIERLLEERDVEHLIVGYPLHMSGRKGKRVDEVDAFIRAAEARFPRLVVVRRDERLSTKEAEERLREAGHHGAERRSRRDAWSALVLLEDWIRDGEPGPE